MGISLETPKNWAEFSLDDGDLEMETRLLTAEDLLSHTHDLLKPCLEIHVSGVPYRADFVTAFHSATRLIATAVNIPKFLSVFVGTTPFEFQMGHHKLIFQQSSTVFGTHLDGYIFLNFSRLNRYSLKTMTGGILEEFVHALMNIKDESLVRTVVGFLLPKGGETT